MEKETVPLYKFRIHAHPKRFAFEKGSCLETEKEETTVFKEALQWVWLGSGHRFQESSSPLRQSASCRPGVLRLLQLRRKKNDYTDYMFYCNVHLLCFNSLVVWPNSRLMWSVRVDSPTSLWFDEDKAFFVSCSFDDWSHMLSCLLVDLISSTWKLCTLL